MKMEDGERRARKSVNYAEIPGVVLDEDFDDDFKISLKGKTEKIKEAREKMDGGEQMDNMQSKHIKDRHRDHKRHKDKHQDDRDRHRKNRDRHKKDRDKHRTGDSRERDACRQEHKKGHRSERRDENDSQDLSRREGSSDCIYDSSSTRTLDNSPATSIPVTLSPLVSPSRRNPKPRLTREEKIFQRELEVVLQLSKEESNKSPSKMLEPKEHKIIEGGVTDNKQKYQPVLSPKSPQGQNTANGCPPSTQNIEVTVEATSITPQKPSTPKSVDKAVVQKFDPRAAAAQTLTDAIEPVPSTSTGKTAKRVRKTVIFKEDSDSDDFGGFDDCYMGAEPETSEESDFMPSPKKKKKKKDSKKTKNHKPTKNSTKKSSIKSTNLSKADNVVPGINQILAKENTAPESFNTQIPAECTTFIPKVAASPEPKVASTLHTPPQAKATIKTRNVAKPLKRPMNNMMPSSSGALPIALVKTPFKSPLSTSPKSGHPLVSSAISVGTKILYRGTGLRLGLSRRVSLKPLHPSASGRITS